MKVKIIRARHSDLWYKNMIGEVVEVKDDRSGHSYTCVKTGHGIYSGDAIKVKEKCIRCIKREVCLINDENKIIKGR